MNRQSIFFTITVSFIISFILVLGSFSILMTYNYKNREEQLLEKYVPIIKMTLRAYRIHNNQIMSKELINTLEEINYQLVGKKSINKIRLNPQTVILVERQDPRSRTLLRMLNLNDKNYIYMKSSSNTILIKDRSSHGNFTHMYIILVFLIVITTIILMYLITLRKLMPLVILKDKVKTLGDENFDFECCDTKRKDEVSLLALEFKNTAKKLKEIKEARNVFIRNIMHELKTPITKGKFLVEIENNEQNDEKLREVFNKLELLINEFASIEELISSNKNIEKKYYYIDDIIDNAKDILMIEDDKVEQNYQNKKLLVNYKLFSIAVKNLMDNAIKYSSNKKVIIESNKEDIIFKNRGDKLKYELKSYYEPFFGFEDNTTNSFGLGIYIVHNILKSNNYTLKYEYKNGVNIFRCEKNNPVTN